MLSIGEFSNICQVSTKTLRYYAEIGLILPDEINPENGYRYYSIEQLKRMLFINRLKSYKRLGRFWTQRSRRMKNFMWN